MSGTRNKNTPGNYCLEQSSLKHSENYLLYPNGQAGVAYDTRLPGNGLNPAQIPGNQLSNNAIQVESFLFGINKGIPIIKSKFFLLVEFLIGKNDIF